MVEEHSEGTGLHGNAFGGVPRNEGAASQILVRESKNATT